MPITDFRVVKERRRASIILRGSLQMAQPNARSLLNVPGIEVRRSIRFVVLATRRDGGATPVRHVLNPPTEPGIEQTENQISLCLRLPCGNVTAMESSISTRLSNAALTLPKSSRPK
jgi:hypothetical protein